MKIKKLGWPLAVLTCLAAGAVFWHSSEPVIAQTSAGTVRTVSARTALSPGHIDASMSKAYILVGKTGLGHEHAVSGRISGGSVRLGAARNAGRIVFDMTSFVADTAEARKYIGLKGTTSASTQRQVNENMLGKDVLDIRQYPTAVFQINSALRHKTRSERGNWKYRLEGQFTLHGVTRPLSLDAEAVERNGRVHLRGAFYVRQTDYGITPYTKFLGAVGVADRLTIYGEIYLAANNPARR